MDSSMIEGTGVQEDVTLLCPYNPPYWKLFETSLYDRNRIVARSACK